jgi:formiminoglutamase
MESLTHWDREDPRLGQLLGRAVHAGEAPRAVLIGFPTDEGVRRNGGRAGAASAPAELRQWLHRLTPDARDGTRFVSLLEHTADLGDVVLTGNLDADQATLGEVVAGQLNLGRFIIVLGGGHETSYGHFLGYAIAKQRPSILNWDAHADVRPLRDRLAHAGSPFRQAIEHPTRTLRSYTVAGLQPHSAAAAHVEYVRRHGRALFRDEVTPTVMRELYAKLEAPGMVSFDMDAVDQAFAPGVSAPASGGFDVAAWLQYAFEAGRRSAVRSCDVVEFNPALDRDGQTGRLAALTVWHILRGFAARG